MAGENVGVYGINQGGLALNSGNYDLSYQGNNLTITKALLDQDYQLLRQKVGPWQSDYQHDANGNIQQHRHSLWGTLDYQ